MDSLARLGAELIQQGYLDYRQRFLEITRRAHSRFVQRNWHGAHDDAVERLNLYKAVVDRVTQEVWVTLASQSQDKSLWASMKNAFTTWSGCHCDFELAQTFFNSITRRILNTIGIDPAVEFTAPDFDALPREDGELEFRIYPCTIETDKLMRSILRDYACEIPYADLAADAASLAEKLAAGAAERWGHTQIERLELIEPVFYRGQGAYIIGRAVSSDQCLPLAIVLHHPNEGIRVDALLTTDDQLSILFSFTRSYFHVNVDRPHMLVQFLKTLMPWKRLAELYISIGFNKHGKTEFFRDLTEHLANSDDEFVIAPGQRGMVMVVFTLASYDLVFKVIKDQFGEPKRTSRSEVMEHYDLVFLHDRAGRLVDAQEFEHLSFARWRFDEALLCELLELAPSTVSVVGDHVVIKHLYLERRLTPLDLYIREVDEERAVEAIIDYGQTIKDLAATNIFPGDVLLKNFGVTRHGRVVFYDYDELCLVTDCHFRKLPQARSDGDEMEADPWFYVGPNDIFPEEFRTFLGLTGRLRDVFLEHHSELFEAAYWRGLQKRHRAGEIMDILPYRQNERLSS